jgi:hypothetical protein
VVFIVYTVQLLVGFAIGALAYNIINPSMSEMKRGVIAGIVFMVFMLATTAFFMSSGFIPDYGHFLNQEE